MKIYCLCPNSFAANTYLLVSGSKAFIVDPSVSVSAVERSLSEHNAELCGILLTHGHFDHTVSVDTIRSKISVPLMIHAKDAPMLTDGTINGFFEFYGKECIHRPADKLLSNGQTLYLGTETIKVISTPGHSPGSVCFLCPDDNGGNFLVTGDTLFSNTIGRCDLWGGNEDTMVESLKLLKALDREMAIYPGHGPSHYLGSALETALYYADF